MESGNTNTNTLIQNNITNVEEEHGVEKELETSSKGKT